jgi:hypothetical protein
MRPLIAALLLVLMSPLALGQHNHSRGHSDYAGWSSGKVSNCCNNDDCGELADDEFDDEFKDGPDGPQVLIDGQWCPVKREHYARQVAGLEHAAML